MKYGIQPISGIDYLVQLDENFSIVKNICSLKGAMLMQSSDPIWSIYNQGICVLTYNNEVDGMYDFKNGSWEELTDKTERLSQAFNNGGDSGEGAVKIFVAEILGNGLDENNEIDWKIPVFNIAKNTLGYDLKINRTSEGVYIITADTTYNEYQIIGGLNNDSNTFYRKIYFSFHCSLAGNDGTENMTTKAVFSKEEGSIVIYTRNNNSAALADGILFNDEMFYRSYIKIEIYP